jgi:hypothetical protein
LLVVIHSDPEQIHLLQHKPFKISLAIGKKIKSLVSDAATCHLPEEKCVIFMYNPFDEVVSGEFLGLKRHFSRYRSIIIYVNDVCSDLVLKFGFVRSYKFKRGVGLIYIVGPEIGVLAPLNESGAI